MSKTIRIEVRLGVFFYADENVWIEYLRLGLSKRTSLDSNGSGCSYVRTMAWLPGPEQQRSKPVPLARIFPAIHARILGEKLEGKGWIVHYKNGDPLDLRIANLEVVSSKGEKNSFNASWTVNARWDIAVDGGDPNKVFAEKRRVYRATHATGSAMASPRDLPPAPGPSHKGKGPRGKNKSRRGKR